MTCAERLDFLKNTTLGRRHLETDLVFCFKILRGLVAGPPEKYGLTLSNRRSHGHSLKLSSHLVKLDVHKFYFTNRICKPWNFLSEEIVTSKNVNIFKQKLGSVNLNDFLNIKLG